MALTMPALVIAGYDLDDLRSQLYFGVFVLEDTAWGMIATDCRHVLNDVGKRDYLAFKKPSFNFISSYKAEFVRQTNSFVFYFWTVFF